MSAELDPVEMTLRRVLEHATVRARVGFERVASASVEEREAILKAYKPFIDSDMAMVHECVQQAQLAGIARVHHALHDSAVDPEMLDEAIHYAESRTK